MIYCLNSYCPSPENPQKNRYCQGCSNPLKILNDRYRPIRPLGEGGFGKVYLAEDIKKLNQLCVIKKFEPNIQGTAELEKAVELFEREAQQLQKLGEEHPQIPQLYAYFEEEGKLYLIQQYIQGENLEDELKREGIFNEEKIISLLKELLEVLKYLHQNDTIHRDIKPPNIMRYNQHTSTEQGSLVLIDLGIAKNINNSTSKSRIKSGTTVGSFGYVPQEQMDEGKVYPASDLYSLGATCFHLLSDVNPWDLWKRKSYDWTKEWKSKIKNPLSDSLVKIIDKLLQVNYQDRYQSAQEVLDDLYCLNPPPPLPQKPLTLQSTTIQPPPTKIIQLNSSKKPRKLIASIVGSSFLVITIVTISNQTHQKPPLEPTIQKPENPQITPPIKTENPKKQPKPITLKKQPIW